MSIKLVKHGKKPILGGLENWIFYEAASICPYYNPGNFIVKRFPGLSMPIVGAQSIPGF